MPESGSGRTTRRHTALVSALYTSRLFSLACMIHSIITIIVEDKISFQLSRESARSQVLCTSAYVLSYWQRVYALSYNERDVDDYSQD